MDFAFGLEHIAHARRRVFIESGPAVPVVRPHGSRKRLQDFTNPKTRLIGRPATELMVASTWSKISSSVSSDGSASPAARPETTILSPLWWTDCSITKPGIRSVKQPEPMAFLTRSRSEYCTTILDALPYRSCKSALTFSTGSTG